MCDSSLSKPSIVANLRKPLSQCNVFKWRSMVFACCRPCWVSLRRPAVTADPPQYADHTMQQCLGCYSGGLTFRLVALDQAGPLSKCVQMPLTCVPAVQD